MEKATFGAGCFWGVEDAFRHVKGVESTAVGYEGGATTNPSYQDVCSGVTGHTEVVEVTYDPAQVSYDDLLATFWEIHNPTERYKAQYKSVIFYHTPAQRVAALASLEKQSKAAGHALATEILPAATFYRAEEYHQQYYDKTGQRSCGNG